MEKARGFAIALHAGPLWNLHLLTRNDGDMGSGLRTYTGGVAAFHHYGSSRACGLESDRLVILAAFIYFFSCFSFCYLVPYWS